MLKIFAIGVLTFVILIALYAVSGVIDSRQVYRDQAVESISSSYASSQTLVGPIFVQPYTQVAKATPPPPTPSPVPPGV